MQQPQEVTSHPRDTLHGGELGDIPELYGVPRPVIRVLLRAQEAEHAARGSEIRRAYRTTRIILGGARELGIPTATLAMVMGVTAGNVANRAATDDFVPVGDFARLAGLSSSALSALLPQNLLGDREVGPTGIVSYRASKLLSALAASDVGWPLAPSL